MTLEPYSLSGYLMATSTGSKVTATLLTEAGALHHYGHIEDTKWDEYLMRSSQPLMMEDRFGAVGPFEYRLKCRRSGSRILIMGENTRIAEAALSKLRAKEPQSSVLIHLTVKVDALVRQITAKPGPYSLSFVHARLQNSSLKATSFYGEDITEASLFRDNLELLTCYTCGLRDVQSATEVLRIGNDGHVFFFAPRAKAQLASRFAEVQSVLSFLSKSEFIVGPEMGQPY